MPDIAMCQNLYCPSRSFCYRHADSGTKPDDRRQPYMEFAYDPDLGYCSDFWNLKPKKETPMPEQTPTPKQVTMWQTATNDVFPTLQEALDAEFAFKIFRKIHTSSSKYDMTRVDQCGFWIIQHWDFITEAMKARDSQHIGVIK